jgi:hypothetical protein
MVENNLLSDGNPQYAVALDDRHREVYTVSYLRFAFSSSNQLSTTISLSKPPVVSG